ncbi:SRPBCC family protein [Leucobacter allii]|uniref:SRPBCC family protein n=1 Tax=Leucobacter allii TaxID=2932247 RepID=A0ABY4FLJ6_9MICO|nr:SRPBCC family protein [Leucobacter allii]UOQ57140.1 SRPBCC family protein [Leucobacter allii]
MARNRRLMRCTPEAVFRVLADGWLYPVWVVGASRMRDVDAHWPAPGARLRHSVGVWPMLIDDTTSSIAWDPPQRMGLQARGWPVGEARVWIEAVPHPEGCTVRITERATRGPARMLPRALTDALLARRNAETLRRLASLAEGGARGGAAGGTAAGAADAGGAAAVPEAPPSPRAG